MRQSIGMSQQLNIIIIFILIVFALLAASLSYYKAFRVNNVIVDSIEKYEGYNNYSKEEINNGLTTLGYEKKETHTSTINDKNDSEETKGYQVKYETQDNGYSYKVTTYMYIDLPIIDIIKIPVKTSTKKMCLGKGVDACK